MDASLQKLAKRASGFSIVLSALLIICGFLAILLPVQMSFGVVIVVSWLLIIGGIVQFVHAFRTEVGHKAWKAAIAILYVITGLYLRVNLGVGVATLTLVLIVFFVAQGFTDIFAYLATRKSGVSGWLLIDGVITLLLGLMIWRHWPSSALWVIGALVGINMISTGVTRLILTFTVRRALKESARAA